MSHMTHFLLSVIKGLYTVCMKPAIPFETISKSEYSQLYDRRLTHQQLARATFYHLYLHYERNDTVVARTAVSMSVQFDILDEIAGNSAAVRLNFLDDDLRKIGFNFETWGEMIDGDIFLERALMTDDVVKGRLRQGILLPYEDEVEQLNYAGFSISDLVRQAMKKPRHRREDSEQESA